ncbi:MAG: hypothetical protein K9J13_05520 [Saprospiraceae bacterium]|nr:hypothetical protein [Saprospiraceae bacterium]
MKNWTEFHIGIVYFSGLIISIITGIVVLLYLRPIKSIIKKITGKLDFVWNTSFKISVLMAGFLGALSVSYRSCNGSYNLLIESRYETAMKGIEQVSVSFEHIAMILGIWLLIFLIFHLALNRKNNNSIKQ